MQSESASQSCFTPICFLLTPSPRPERERLAFTISPCKSHLSNSIFASFLTRFGCEHPDNSNGKGKNPKTTHPFGHLGCPGFVRVVFGDKRLLPLPCYRQSLTCAPSVTCLPQHRHRGYGDRTKGAARLSRSTLSLIFSVRRHGFKSECVLCPPWSVLV